MELGSGLVEGRFLTRLNRFAAMVEVAGKEVMVHVANSGRMRELFVPGIRVLVSPAEAPHRKTKFDLALVDLGTGLASADARLPNALFAEALEREMLPEFREYTNVRRESTYGESRLDFQLDGPSGRCYVETKSVTLVVDGVGLFPDAPTIRGTKHLHSLADAVGDGCRAAAVFVIQRGDVESFSTQEAADTVFASTLREVMALGVEAYAYRCSVTEQNITLTDKLPQNL